jgi:MoaA/NifB/PqqE/SkfB family radical SAM enzyme
MGITERIDKVTSIPKEYRGEVLPAPISVKIELTSRCNYKCHFCATSKGLRAKGNMDFDLYERIVDEMLGAGVKELGMFYLGESFLYPRLQDAIRYAKHRGCEYVFLTANGSIASESKVEACMMAGLNSLKWSFNYADADQLVEIAGVKRRYWDNMIKNIKDAWSIREYGSYPCKLYASYIDYDGEQGERMQKAIEEIRHYVDEIYALPLYNQADLVTEQELEKGWTPTAGNRGRLGALRPGLPCWALFTEGHVTYDGLLTGCCFDHNAGFVFGDLKEMSFMDAWNSERAQWFRRHHLAEDVTGTPCENCVVKA